MRKLERQLRDIINNNDLEELKKFFINSYRTNEYINTALLQAVTNNSLEMVIYLVEKGATSLDYALIYASDNNNLETAKYLIYKGATNLDKALDYASNHNHLEIVKYLKFYKYIIENHLCPAKYKNTLFLS